VKAHTGIPHHVHGEEPDPDEIAGYARIAATEGALLARTLARGFRELNVDLLRVTGGRIDLGFAITLAFVSAGLTQLVRQRRVPVPPWFNLAWGRSERSPRSRRTRSHAAPKWLCKPRPTPGRNAVASQPSSGRPDGDGLQAEAGVRLGKI
jgi:hypothetical protein